MKSWRFWRPAGALLGFVVLGFVYTKLSAHVPKTSDQANFFLAAQDFLAGNRRLAGWTIVPDNFWTSDIVVGAALSWFWGHFGSGRTPSILVVQPALEWAALVVAAIATALRGQARVAAPGLIVLAILGWPLIDHGISYFIMLSAIHVGSMLYCLAAFFAAERAMGSPRKAVWLALCGVTLFAGAVGDPLVVLAGAAPIGIAGLAVSWRRAVPLCLVAAIAVLAAHAALAINAATGGFVSMALPLRFAPFGQLGTNAAVTVQALLQLFSADFFGSPLHAALVPLLHLPLLAGALLALWLPVRAALRHRDAPSFLTLALVAGSVLDIAALILSDRVALEQNGIAAGRYLYPAWIFTAILLARAAATLPKPRADAAAGFAAVALLATTLANAQWLRRTPADILYPPQRALLNSLLAHGLDHGLGAYWQSGLLTVASRGEIRVYGAAVGAAGKIVMLPNIQKAYAMGDVTQGRFFVLVPHPSETYSDADVERSFGNPVDAYISGGWTVDIYSKK